MVDEITTWVLASVAGAEVSRLEALLGGVSESTQNLQGRLAEAEVAFATFESVKAVSELYAPVDMTIVSVNEQLAEQPEMVNEDPLGQGYFVAVNVLDESQISDLMNLEDYEAMAKSGG